MTTPEQAAMSRTVADVVAEIQRRWSEGTGWKVEYEGIVRATVQYCCQVGVIDCTQELDE